MVKGFSCTGYVQVIGWRRMARPQEEITEIQLRVRSSLGEVSHLKFPRSGHIFILNVGSGPNCMVRDECLANSHASIELFEFSAFIVAHDATAGVILNGDRVHGKASLKDGDEIKCGGLQMQVQFGHPGMVGKLERAKEDDFCATCREPWARRPSSCKDLAHWSAYTEFIEMDRAHLQQRVEELSHLETQLQVRGDRCHQCGRKDVRLVRCQTCLENSDERRRLGEADDSAQ